MQVGKTIIRVPNLFQMVSSVTDISKKGMNLTIDICPICDIVMS